MPVQNIVTGIMKTLGKAVEELISIIILKSFQVSTRRKIQTLLKLGFLIFVISLLYYLLRVTEVSIDEWAITSLQVVIFYLVINILFHLLRIVIVSIYRKRNKFSQAYQDNFIHGSEKLANLLIYVIFACSLLFFFGVDLKSFFTTLGLFSVAIAWIFKEKITNLIDGIVIMFSNDIRLKDYLCFKELIGRIVEVNFHHTKMKTDDGNYVYIPNTNLVNAEFTNFSKSSTKRIRFHFELSERYYGCLEQLEENLRKGLKEEFDELIMDDSIALKVERIKEDASELLLEMTVTKFNFSIDERIKRYASRQIIRFIDEQRRQDEMNRLA